MTRKQAYAKYAGSRWSAIIRSIPRIVVARPATKLDCERHLADKDGLVYATMALDQVERYCGDSWATKGWRVDGFVNV
jgi:hypothetical protein